MFCLSLCSEGGCPRHWGPSRKRMAHSSWVIRGGCTQGGAASRDGAVPSGWWPWDTGLHPLPSRGRGAEFARGRAVLRGRAGCEEGASGQGCELPLREMLVLSVPTRPGWSMSLESPSVEVCGQEGPPRDSPVRCGG